MERRGITATSMAQWTNYNDQGSQDLNPRSFPQLDMAWSSNSRRRPRGVDMKYSHSDESNSRNSEFSDAAPTPGTSPNTAMSAYNTPPDHYDGYEYHYTTTETYPSEPSNSYEIYRSTQNHPAKVEFETYHEAPERKTPSSLGWSPDTHLIKLYKFMPGKGKDEPHFTLLPQWTVTFQTPKKVYLDQPSNPKRHVYPCQFPGSCPRTFNRPADLARHYENVHVPLEDRKKFICDYVKCGRSTDAFSRKDHFRDHLRDYHKEYLGKAKDNKNLSRHEWEKLQKKWLKDRVIYESWWRCTKCLLRNYIEKHGWECQSCKQPCEPERKEACPRKIVDEAYQYVDYDATCSTCGGGKWSEDGQQNWASCPNCQPPSEPDYYEGGYVNPRYTYGNIEEEQDNNQNNFQ